MDIVDTAQHQQEQLLSMTLANHRAAWGHGHQSAEYCLECGEEIPAARRLACPGCSRCRECQEEVEACR